jgi:hypothetical protein
MRFFSTGETEAADAPSSAGPCADDAGRAYRLITRRIGGQMRKRVLVAAFLATAGAILAAASPITERERQRLIAHMQMTASWLEDEVSGLSPAQAAFRPSATSWTILEVLDHLVVVGPIYWEELQSAKPVVGRAGMMNDIDVLWYGIDRTFRETALKTEEPSRTRRDVQSGVTAYRTQHARLLEYVRTTTDDLRSRLVERQNCDAYQWALLTSTHEQRHVLQIREIKAHPNYPKG